MRMIWQKIFIISLVNIGLSLTLPTLTDNVFYFPDPANEGEVIPAYLNMQPSSILDATDNSSIEFYLVTSKNIGQPQQIFPYDLESIKNSYFIPDAPLKIMSHGFGGSHNDGFPRRIANAFLEEGFSGNIILINWAQLATSPWYTIAAPATKTVGITAGNFLKFLMENGLLYIDDIHIIGFSLGAHVAGNIGHELLGQVPRVTAMDPALPLFDIVTDEDRIDPSDGRFVEVIHTSGGFLHENGLAFASTRGHVDFFPNNGKHQPGCEGEPFGSCSHGRTPTYYEEAIRKPEQFLACPCGHWDLFLTGKCSCTNYIHFGPNSPTTARGKYYFLTQDRSPYGMGVNGLV